LLLRDNPAERGLASGCAADRQPRRSNGRLNIVEWNLRRAFARVWTRCLLEPQDKPVLEPLLEADAWTIILRSLLITGRAVKRAIAPAAP
jgi:hypothetical protein